MTCKCKKWKELVENYSLYYLKHPYFIRPHLDYGGVVYGQTSNDAFSKKLKTVQCNAATEIMGARKGTLHQESGSEYLQQRRWMRCLCLFYKIVSFKLPAYICDVIPPVRQS